MKWFDYRDAKALVQSALEAGIHYFDTGHSYCDGAAEDRLGRILSELADPNVVVSTKVGTIVGEDGTLKKDYSADSMERSLLTSLDRLGRTHVDLLMTHGPLRTVDLTCSVIGFLLDMRERGLTRAIGASCDGEVARVLAHEPHLDFLMTSYNWYDRTNSDAMKIAQDHGISVVVKSPLASGVSVFPRRPLLSRTNMWYNARLTVRKRDLIRERLRNRNPIDIEEMIRFSAAGPAVTTLVFGTTSTEHLRSNIDALSRVRPNPPESSIQGI